MELDLPLVWAGLISTAVFLYVLLDGLDLGIGILFPFATPQERDQMMASIAPVWDGNETWLVLGGGGLLAAFPLAYATILPAMYLPIGFMLTALIFRGVAFEFRANAGPSGLGKRYWTVAFWGGSLGAALSQGLILGAFITGIEIEGRAFAGGALDWFSPFGLLVAVSVAAGYVLLGAGWLIIKTEGELYEKARRWAQIAVVVVTAAMGIVSVVTLLTHPSVIDRWGVSLEGIDWGTFLPVAPAPLIAGLAALWCFMSARNPRAEWNPFLAGGVIFLAGFAGLALSIFPYVVPYEIDIWEAAAADNALSLLLVGAVVLLPVILGYTAYVWWVFRGKVGPDAHYHH